MIRTIETFPYSPKYDSYETVDTNGTVVVKYIGDAEVGITLTLFTEDAELCKKTFIVPVACINPILECLGEFNREYLLSK